MTKRYEYQFVKATFDAESYKLISRIYLVRSTPTIGRNREKHIRELAYSLWERAGNQRETDRNFG